ncbi:MAG: ATP-binding protein [Candidatus Omnitrophota bacterium]
MVQFIVASFLTAVATFALAIFVFLYNRRGKVNRIFCVYSLSIAEWSFFTALHGMTDVKWISFAAAKIMHVGVFFIPVLFFHFTLQILYCLEKYRKVLKAGYVLSSCLAAVNFATPFIVRDVSPKLGYHYFMSAGSLYPVVIVIFLFFATSGLYLLLKSYRASHGKKRNQLKYLFWGSLLGYTMGISNFLPVYGITVFPYPFGSYGIALYVAITAYAIVRYQFLDIEVIVKKTLVFTGLFIATYAIFSGFASLGTFIFEDIVRSRWLAMVPSVFVIVLLFHPLESFLRMVTDKYLFQKKYDVKQILKTFANEVLTVLDLNDLIHQTVNKITEIMKLESGSVFLYDKAAGNLSLAAGVDVPIGNYTVNIGQELLSELFRNDNCVYVGGPDNETAHKKLLPRNIRAIFGEMDPALVIPLAYRNDAVGLMALGKKKSDEEFTPDDIDILLPLARTLSIAITNASLFEQLSEAQAQAAQREKMAVIGTLSAGINHEICNPLGIARGQCEMFLLNMADGVYKDKSPRELLLKAQEIMRKVIKETDRATVITRKLSSFAKPAKGEMADNVQVEKELEEVISLVEHDLSLDDITVSREIQTGLPPISADRKQLQEIFFNIIRNAAQSIRGKGEIIVRIFAAAGKVRIDIADNGAGINKMYLDRIFDPFFTTKDPGEGTGLGLFIVKQIIERNNGSISVESLPEEGTVFHIAFEIARREGIPDANRVCDRVAS